MNPIVAKILAAIISKRKIIGWVSSAIFVSVAAALSMNPEEFKEAVCGAPIPKAESQAVETVPVPAPAVVK